jgi:hypothetical protein
VRLHAKTISADGFEHRAIELLERVTTIYVETMEIASAMQNLICTPAERSNTMIHARSVVGVRSFVLNGNLARHG